MREELKALREEVNALRERLAVLEAKTPYWNQYYYPTTIQPRFTYSTGTISTSSTSLQPVTKEN